MTDADYPYPVDHNEFKQKRILVTGGTKGMGEAIVRRFTLAGARVATTARSPLPQGQAPTLFIREDIASSAGVKKVADRILDNWGGIGIGPGSVDKTVGSPQYGQGMVSPIEPAGNSSLWPQAVQKPFRTLFSSVRRCSLGRSASGSGARPPGAVGETAPGRDGGLGAIMGGTGRGGGTVSGGAGASSLVTSASGPAGIRIVVEAGVEVCDAVALVSCARRSSRDSKALSCLDKSASSCCSRDCWRFSKSNSNRSWSFMVVLFGEQKARRQSGAGAASNPVSKVSAKPPSNQGKSAMAGVAPVTAGR